MASDCLPMGVAVPLTMVRVLPTIISMRGMTSIPCQLPPENAVADTLGEVNSFLANGMWTRDLSAEMQKWTDKLKELEEEKKSEIHDITYTTGDTFDNHIGNEVNIHVGFAADIIDGDSVMLTTGNSAEHFRGDSNWFFAGLHNELIMGATTSTHVGAKKDFFLGGSMETRGGLSVKFELAGETGVSAVSDKFLKNSWSETDVKKIENRLSSIENVLKKEESIMDMKLTALKYNLQAMAVDINSVGSINFKTVGIATVNGSIIKLG